MDIGLRESLIIIGMIVIAGILFDGYRRMKINRRRARDLSLGMGAGLQNDVDDFNSELPNGGARVIAQAGQPVILDDEVPTVAEETVAPEPPLINTPVAAEKTDKVTPLQQYKTAKVSGASNNSVINKRASTAKPIITSDAEVDDDVLIADKTDHYTTPVTKPTAARVINKSTSKQKTTKRAPVKTVKQEPATTVMDQSNRAAAEEVIIINVVAKTEEGFVGSELLHALLANGLKFGEMQIFHRHEQPDGNGCVLFSAANGVEPGYFDLASMERLQTSVVSLFMSLPGPPEPMKAFEEMAMAAYYLSRSLQGELKDEQHSVMTQQTLEHCRQRIMDYERRVLVRKQSVQ
ncbi:cell division protein ZipA [Endozoicomonas sp. SM1973]|uniref:Cell division protein ZipA n=1 Tax=Spartinivicinus marinus TaxID=2994442 RepID=A0A853I5P0_9GAMM|nr:cell division protein ZipA [Spartinivicinus marinus]MCX4028963.1 cell division protein ZipA [Spartinivicinus marinus]NYZ65454.1 cell division protein ZipA [Spartinivicinus marinus]